MTGASIRVEAVRDAGTLMDSVIALADQNWDRLGFVPEEALRKAARKGEILAGIADDGALLGYVWYSITQSAGEARIHHLCIDPQRRRSGVGRILVAAVKERTLSLRGITLRCRRDFRDACNFWRQVGFIPLTERPGRGRESKVLTCFRYDHGHPDLWTEHWVRLAQSKAIAVLDANVFFDLQDEASASNRESRALEADWIQDFAALWITEELHNEIDRHENANERRRRRAFANGFPVLQSQHAARDRALAAVAEVLPTDRSDSDKSDRRHLAAASAGSAHFFITRDRALLQSAPQIAECLNVSVVSPLEFILSIDELQRKWHYQPARLAGSAMTIQGLGANDVAELRRRFLNHGAGETNGEFEERLRAALGDVGTARGFVVRGRHELQALLVLACKKGSAVEIALLRVRSNLLGPTLACHLVCRAVATAVREESALVLLSDAHCPDFVRDACVDLDFLASGTVLVKTIMPGVHKLQHAANRLAELSASHSALRQPFDAISASLARCSLGCTPLEIAQVEHVLWPLKIDDDRAASFMVPINPEWAKQLFDERLAAQGLFAVDTFLSLQYENVYYRAAQPHIVTAPSRVLWYVSEDRRYEGTAQIRASSTVEEVVVGPARVLFKRFRRLGVYRWDEVLSLAKNDPEGEIMAFRFGGTESLPHPIPRDQVREILRSKRDKTPQFTTALKLTAREFSLLYGQGVGQAIKG